MVNKKRLKKTVLILGGTGFLGHHLSKKLVKQNYRVISISLTKPKKIRKIKNVKYLLIDIRSKKELFKIDNIKSIDFVINFSGYIDHTGNKKKLKTHYQGVKNLISRLLNKNIKLFIQSGTSLEYGKSAGPHIEKKKSVPVSSYAKSKYLANLYLEKVSKRFGINYLILRIYQIYGPGQNADRLIPQVIKSCLANKKFNCSEGNQKRDFLFIDDFVDLIIKIIKSKKTANGLYNVGTSNPIKIKELIINIREIVKRGTPIFGKIKMRKEEVLSYFPDTSKIRKYFNWKPKITLKDGLIKTIKFYENNK